MTPNELMEYVKPIAALSLIALLALSYLAVLGLAVTEYCLRLTRTYPKGGDR